MDQTADHKAAHAIAARITAHITSAASKGRKLTAAQAAQEIAALDTKVTCSNQSAARGETDRMGSTTSAQRQPGLTGYPTMEQWWALPSDERVRRNLALVDAKRAYFNLKVQAPGSARLDAANATLQQAKQLTPWPHGC